MVDTKGLLILGTDYKKSFLRIMGESPANKIDYIPQKLKPFIIKQMSVVKLATIRKTTGRVGETRYVYFDQIGSITLLESRKTQKRWYKCFILFNEEGKKHGQPAMLKMYIFLPTAILDDLVAVCSTPDRTI